MPLDALRIVGGTALVVLAIVEIVTTTISVSGVQGPLTSRLNAGVWRVLRAISDRDDLQPVLYASGPLMILLTFLMWVLLAVAGWGVLFSAEGAVEARGEATLTPWDPFFYAAGQILGLGGPDIGTAQAGWKAVEQLLALNGVALLSLALAWIIPVVGAVVEKRRIATRMYLLGDTPTDVIERAEHHRDLGDLHLYLNAVADGLTDLSHRQFAFPVVQYFFTPDLRAAMQPRLAILTEATFVLAAVPDEERLVHPAVLQHYWRAVEDYLDRLTERFAPIASDPPDSPGEAFVGAGVLSDLRALSAVHEEHERLRRMVKGAMDFAGWRWDRTVLASPEEPDADQRRS